MPYSKLKNLIILLLVLVNLLLLAILIPLRRESRQQQELADAALESLFAQYGVTLESGTLPATQQLYTLEFSPDGDALPAMRALLGDNVLLSADDSTRYVQIYSSPQGECQLSRTGALEARLSGRTAQTDLQQAAAAEMEAMGMETAFVSAPSRSSAGIYTVTATQQLLGVPVFSSALEFTYFNGLLTRISGTVFPDTSNLTRTDDTAGISCADALVSFLSSRDQLGWVGSMVTDVTQGYYRLDTASAAVIRLVPGWRITTDTGAFWVNGISREVLSLDS